MHKFFSENKKTFFIRKFLVWLGQFVLPQSINLQSMFVQQWALLLGVVILLVFLSLVGMLLAFLNFTSPAVIIIRGVLLFLFIGCILLLFVMRTSYLPQAEQAALEDLEIQKKYETLLDNTPMLIIRLDKESCVLYANSAMANIVNLPARQLTGKLLADIFTNQSLVQHLQASAAQVFGTSQPAKIAFNINGRFYTWYLAPEFNAKGMVTSVVATAMDTTDLKLSDEALRASELRFRAMNDASPFGIFIDDPDGNTIYFNQTYLLLTGISEEQASAGKWRDIIHPDDRERVFDARSRALSMPPYRFESVHRYLHPNGKVIWVSTKTLAMFDGERLLGYFGLIEDITARIEEINARISSDEALRRRTEDLEKAVNDLEGFSYTVSHDLRAPLRAIDGYSRLLQSEIGALASPDIEYYLKNIRENAQHMGHLIDDLLAFSRLGRSTLGITEVDMRALAQSVVESLRQEFTDDKVVITVHEIPNCMGDAALLRQVWFNLIANAIKFSSKVEAPHILIGSQSDEKDKVTYFVQDNGVGFDMAHAGKLFGVFQRLHPTDEFEGTGVGLAIVDRIVKKHGGKAWAKSLPGAGATFYFTLPTKAHDDLR